MVNKREGTVEYAVMSFGGFLGIGERYHPLPWKVLTYDNDQGGYVVDLDKAMLEKAPSYRSGAEPRFDRAYGEQEIGGASCRERVGQNVKLSVVAVSLKKKRNKEE